MTDDILTNDAIRKLTGYKQPKKQCAWLAAAGIWFKEDRNGYCSAAKNSALFCRNFRTKRQPVKQRFRTVQN